MYTMDEATTTARTAIGNGRAMVEAAVFVGGWTALGLAIRAPILYLLIGLPLVAAFQVRIRRRPLRELWVRDGSPFRLDGLGRLVAALLMVGPAVLLARAVTAGDWPMAAVYGATLVGAVAGGYAFRQLRRDRARTTLRWLTIATVPIVGLTLIKDLPGLLGAADRPSWPSVFGTGVVHLLWLVPGMFVIEEVAFRGLLDSHVHRPGGRHQWLSALYVSALWGIWHLPFVGAAGLSGLPLPILVPALVVPHCLLGVPLSFAWRRTGNLWVPAFAHGFGDAVRDALMISV